MVDVLYEPYIKPALQLAFMRGFGVNLLSLIFFSGQENRQ